MAVENDPYSDLAGLDFRDQESLARVLRRDKHTRIEGICTEHLFLRQLIETTFSAYSVGWWFTQKRGTYTIIKFCKHVGEIDLTDLKILNFFKDKGLSTFIVAFDHGRRSFYYVNYTMLPSTYQLDDWHRARVPFPHRKRKPPPIPKPSERDAVRSDQAIGLLRSLGVLQSAALERVFANCWLPGRDCWDIDCFALHDDRILAFEVKQKYPTAMNTFGLNVGLARLFAFLTDLGIEVYHIILTKPTRDYRIPAIDFYTKERYKSKLDWCGIKFSSEILTRRRAVAPKKNQHLWVRTAAVLSSAARRVSFHQEFRESR
ncbi:hypothetical protein MJD09_16575 [bacterium]|nr:hypothetical protein [bacterium]